MSGHDQFVPVSRRRKFDGKMPSRTGISLFELIIVVAVIGVLVSVSAPAVMSLFGRQTKEQAVSSVLQFFGEVRREAIVSGQSWWVRYSRDVPGMVAGVDGEGSRKQLTLDEKVVLESNVEWMSLGSDVLVDVDITWVDAAWSPEVPFYPDGTSGDALIVVRAEQNRPAMIEVRGLIGHADVIAYDESKALVTASPLMPTAGGSQ